MARRGDATGSPPRPRASLPPDVTNSQHGSRHPAQNCELPDDDDAPAALASVRIGRGRCQPAKMILILVLFFYS